MPSGPNRTWVILLDRSASMFGERYENTVNAVSEMVSGVVGDVRVCVFNEKKTFVHHGYWIAPDGTSAPGGLIQKLHELGCGGQTSLFDVLFETIIETRADTDGRKVTFIIATDGNDTSSSTHTAAECAELVESTSDALMWDFVFIGIGGFDAMSASASIGVSRDHTIVTDTQNIPSAVRAVSDNVIRDRRLLSFSKLQRQASAGVAAAAAEEAIGGIGLPKLKRSKTERRAR